MQIESVATETLVADPANVRSHDEANVRAIMGSLRRFGQQKPIVIDAQGVVRAGNGTLAAARRLGWSHLSVVRTNLAGPEATAYAIADNRSAELAAWDLAALTRQWEAFDEELRDATGFDGAALEKLTGAEAVEDALADLEEKAIPECYQVSVDCRDEADQKEFFERMQAEGRTCRVLTL